MSKLSHFLTLLLTSNAPSAFSQLLQFFIEMTATSKVQTSSIAFGEHNDRKEAGMKTPKQSRGW